jgi:dTDP-glucose 4,6-dehydratase
MKACVLGAGGCFGQNTAAYFQKHGWEVFGIGRNPPKHPAFTLGRDFPYHAYHVHYELQYVIDLLDKEKPDVIVNYAAQGEQAASFNPADYWRFYETNVMGLAKLTGYLQERDYLKRFVQVGSSELYGSVAGAAPEDAPARPTSPYGVSKAAADWHLLALHQKFGFPVNIIRPANGYCPGQQLHRVIPKAIIHALSGRKLPLHGGGKAQKAFLHGDDISAGIFVTATKGEPGKVYNVGPEHPMSIRAIVALIAELLDKRLEDIAELAPERFGQDAVYWPDAAAITKELGWGLKVKLMDGLQDMVEWVRAFPDLLTMPTDYRMRA